jgi:glycosyltransferase 2 family protein
VNEKRKSWQAGAKAAFGVLLLVWIFHCIFVNEARTQARQGRLLDANGQRLNWDSLSRVEEWRYGWRYGPPALAATLGSVQPLAYMAALVLMGGMLYVGAVRWRIVLRAQDLELPLRQTLRITMIAHFFNAFLLGTAGGDVAKAYYAARETHHKKTEAVLTVFVDRVIGLWAMLLFGGMMILPNYPFLLRPGLRTVIALLLAMLAAASVFAFLAFRGGVSRAWAGAHDWLRRLPKGEWLERTLESCRQFGRSHRFVSKTLALSMLVNVLLVLQFYVLARGLSIQVSLATLGLVVPVVICLSALPISPAGLGVRENLFVQLLAAPVIGVPATLALSLSLLAYSASLAWSLLGGLVYLTLKDRRHFKELAQEE